MLSKLKVTVGIFLFIGFLVLSYKMGELKYPQSSFDSAYEKVKGLNEDITTSFSLEGQGDFSYSYIPAYSHVYFSEGDHLDMAITLSLRNTDMKNPITIEQILYYNTRGDLIRKYLKESTILEPLATKEIFIERRDVEGGSGANFVILFQSDQNVLPPIFEAIMVGEQKGKSYIFNSRGVTYFDHKSE